MVGEFSDTVRESGTEFTKRVQGSGLLSLGPLSFDYIMPETQTVLEGSERAKLRVASEKLWETCVNDLVRNLR